MGCAVTLIVDDQSPVDADNDQRKEHAQIDRRNHEQTERCDTFSMVSEERLPTLRRWPASFGHVLGNRGLRDLKAELQEFAVNPWGAPSVAVIANANRTGILPDAIAQSSQVG